MGLTYPHPCLPRLRSVKIEQGKVNDQANTLADLAKVSIGQDGEERRGTPRVECPIRGAGNPQCRISLNSRLIFQRPGSTNRGLPASPETEGVRNRLGYMETQC